MFLTYSIIISGRVQGVFFRQTAKEKATVIGITGEVMNLPDGSVNIIATGTKEQLEELLAWCRQGPPKAKVEEVTTAELPLKEFSSFAIKRY